MKCRSLLSCSTFLLYLRNYTVWCRVIMYTRRLRLPTHRCTAVFLWLVGASKHTSHWAASQWRRKLCLYSLIWLINVQGHRCYGWPNIMKQHARSACSNQHHPIVVCLATLPPPPSLHHHLTVAVPDSVPSHYCSEAKPCIVKAILIVMEEPLHHHHHNCHHH